MTTQESADRRPTEPQILSPVAAGLSHSATCCRRVPTLNDSNAIVYVEPRHTWQALVGYLTHNIVARGECCDLHVAAEHSGTQRPLFSLPPHEQQHRFDVGETADARDAESPERMFKRTAVRRGCGDGVESTRGLTSGSGSTQFCHVSWWNSQDNPRLAVMQHSMSQNGLVRQFCPNRVGPFPFLLRVPHSQMSGHSSSTGSPAVVPSATEPPMIRVLSAGDPAVTTLLHDAYERSATFRRLVDTINGTEFTHVNDGCRAEPTAPHPCRYASRPAGSDELDGPRASACDRSAARARSEDERPDLCVFERLGGSPNARGQLEFETEVAMPASISMLNQGMRETDLGTNTHPHRSRGLADDPA
jgi:hypothetical protein